MRLGSFAVLLVLWPLSARAGGAEPRLPDRLATLIHAAYADNAQAENVTRQQFLHSAAAFDAHWAAYQARHKEVVATIADADAKHAKGDIDGAIAALRGAVTPVDPGASKGVVKRQMIEARDAELPAIVALLKLAAEKHDYTLAFDLAADLAVRRRVSDDVEAERMRWFAFRNRTSLENLAAGMTQDTEKQIQALERDADDAALDGMRMATGIGGSLGGLGVHFAALADAKSAKPGEWIFATLSRAKIAGRTLTYHYVDTTPIRFDCHDTARIDYVNPVTGVIVWQQDCKTRPNKVELWLDAALAQDAPVAVTTSRMPFGVIGRVEKAGPKWKLADASVVDLEKTRAAPTWRVDETETIEAGGKIGVQKR